MKKIVILSLFLIVLLMSCSKNVENNQVNSKDRDLVAEVTTGNKDDKKEKEDSIDETMLFEGIFTDFKLNMPKYDSIIPDMQVVVEADGLGMTIRNSEYMILFIELTERSFITEEIPLDTIEDSSQILDKFLEYTVENIEKIYLFDDEYLDELVENSLKVISSNKTELNGYDTSIIEYEFDASLTDGNTLHFYNYGYFIHYNENVLMFYVSDPNVEIVKKAKMVMDKFMQSFE